MGKFKYYISRCILPIFGQKFPEDVKPLILDKEYEAEIEHFRSIAQYILEKTDIDENALPFVMQLLSTLDNHSLRFIGAFCLKFILRQFIRKNKDFKTWIEK